MSWAHVLSCPHVISFPLPAPSQARHICSPARRGCSVQAPFFFVGKDKNVHGDGGIVTISIFIYHCVPVRRELWWVFYVYLSRTCMSRGGVHFVI